MYTTNVYTCLNIRHIVFYRYSFLLSWPVVLIFLTLLTLLFHLLCWSWHTHLLSRDIHQCCASFTWYFALHWPYIPSYSCNCVKFKFAIFFLPPRSGSSELSITLIPDHLMPSSGLCGNLLLVVHLHKNTYLWNTVNILAYFLAFHFTFAAWRQICFMYMPLVRLMF